MSPALMRRLLALVAALAPLSCMAHGLEAGGGLARGLLHPIGGADHLLAMVGVGIVSTKLGGRWIWALPLTFLVAMTLGFWLGAAHPDGAQRASEWGVLLSVLVLGALTAMPKVHVPAMAWTAALLFGVCHGHAHGAELPGDLSPWAFSAGFLLATAGFHLMGAIVGSLCQHQPRPARNFAVVGATVGLAGIVLVVKAGL